MFAFPHYSFGYALDPVVVPVLRADHMGHICNDTTAEEREKEIEGLVLMQFEGFLHYELLFSFFI